MKFIAFSIKIIHNKNQYINIENLGRGRLIGRFDTTGFLSGANNVKITFTR